MGMDGQLEWIENGNYIKPGRDGLRIFEFWKKTDSCSTTVEVSSWVFRIWSDQSSGLDWQRRVEILDTTRCTARHGAGVGSIVYLA